MFYKCKKEHYEDLMKYLQKEQILNTFIIADMEIYGFDKEFQQIYASKDEDGQVECVALIFHNNLILSGSKSRMDYKFLGTLLTDDINNIMGEASLVEALRDELSIEGSYIEKQMFTLASKEQLTTGVTVKVATNEDVDRIYDFLMQHDEIKHLYHNKSMIANRITSGEGIHIMAFDGDKIIAHGNTAAGTDSSSMIGGIAVDSAYRNKGIGKNIVSELSSYIINNNKKACLFAGTSKENNLFVELGFEVYKRWGTQGITSK